jgi:D-glycero-alpha-D-manno-heptose-7-phosphate kinase
MGGGTDLPSFYEKEEGMVLSNTVDKYMYITVNDRFDNTFRLSYSRTEITNQVDEIEHPIIKTVLQKYAKDRKRGLEIISMADIPSGTGLGSSSSFTVGLLHAMKAHMGVFQSADDLAKEASHIEIVELKEPIGKQDQYAASYGGLQLIRFLPNGEVRVDPVICPDKTKKDLESSVMFFYTGVTRSASKILGEQSENTSAKMDFLREMKSHVLKLKTILEQGEKLQKFGEILNAGWKLKKNMASGISNSKIDEWYERGVRAGAWGGKILGAGGGGFLMFLCPPDKQAQVQTELRELRPVPVRFENQGSKIIFVG